MDEYSATGHRPMESQNEGATLDASFADLCGAAVPPLLDARIASLMWSFTQLTPHGQKRFMELLNEYLYASPMQRRQMRTAWDAMLDEPCACGHADEEPWLHVRRKA